MAFDATTFEIDPLTLTTPRARLEYLRDFLRRVPEERFDMRALYSVGGEPTPYTSGRVNPATDCGTAACIAGWTLTLFGAPANEGADEAGELLGLGEWDGEALFIPSGFEGRGFATARQAADVIDHLLHTGEVDWSVAAKA